MYATRLGAGPPGILIATLLMLFVQLQADRLVA